MLFEWKYQATCCWRSLSLGAQAGPLHRPPKARSCSTDIYIYIYIYYIYYIYIDIYYIHTYTYIRYSKICHLYDRYILFTYMLLLICYYSVPCGVRSHEPWIWYSAPVVITILQLQSTKSETLKKNWPKNSKKV